MFKGLPLHAQEPYQTAYLDFYGDSLNIPASSPLVNYNGELSTESILQFYKQMEKADYTSVVAALQTYKKQHNPDDWLYYQLIRKAAQRFSPKGDNYTRYTLYKWFFLNKSGFEAILRISKEKILFYVRSDERIYNIPTRIQNGKQYVCLNFHDYDRLDLEKESFQDVPVSVPEGLATFSYKLTRLPKFKASDYTEKLIQFRYNEHQYDFRIKINPQVKAIFANYPVVDYASYFGAPLSNETYRSLINELRAAVKGMNKKNGIDYLMRFTRYAFPFKGDTENFGTEKRLLPEQTLFYEGSDCEDRTALFFYLVKEIYDLPMIVLSFPQHVTIAVKLDKAIGHTIDYNGEKYSVCEPTPQKEDLSIGQISKELKSTPFEVSYAYTPGN